MFIKIFQTSTTVYRKQKKKEKKESITKRDLNAAVDGLTFTLTTIEMYVFLGILPTYHKRCHFYELDTI